MKITIESTTQIVEVNGVPARVWVGRTESGVEIQALVTCIAVEKSLDCSQFEAELAACESVSLAVQIFPLRMIL